MGLLVRTAPVSVRHRSSNQDDGNSERNRDRSQPTIDRSLLDRDTLNFLVCQVRHRHEKNRGRSKKSLRKTEKQRRRVQIKERQKHIQENTRCLDFERQRTVLLSEISDSERDIVLSEMNTQQDITDPQDDNIVTMGQAFECIARADYSLDGHNDSDDDTEEYFSCSETEEDEDVNERDGERSYKDSRFSFGGLSKFSRGNSASRSSHSSTSSTFAKIIGKLGQSRWASTVSTGRNNRMEEKEDADCHEKGNEGCHRSSFEDATVDYHENSSIFDFDDDDNDDEDEGQEEDNENVAEKAEIQGTSQDSVRDRESDAIFNFKSNVEDEELDPIFVSGLDEDSLGDVSKSESGMFTAHSGSLLDNIDDDVSDDDESVGVNNDESRGDPVSRSVIAFPEDREEDTIDILGRDVAAGEVSNVDQTTMTRSNPPSRKPDPLWVRNHDRRNELAWIRCAARNRERPMDFPIARKRRSQLVEGKEESQIPDMCDTWFFSCGDVFDM